MKHLCVVVGLLLTLWATEGAAKNAYSKGDLVGQTGIGIGGLGGFYGSASLPVIAAGVDVGIEKMISVGGVVGYTASSQEYGYIFQATPTVYKWKYTYITVAARGSYHFLQLDHEKIDLYAGLGLGFNIVSASFEGNATLRPVNTGSSGSYLFFGFHAGGRYYFSPNFATFAELGYGVGILNVGIALKL